MTDKKLTDKEIIKALECCKYEYDTKCELCCYNFYSRIGCRGELRRNALDLITRQQAEIDSLRADLKWACAERDAQIICKNSFIESASILDFAERLKRKAVGLKLVNRDYRFVSVKEIDSLVIKIRVKRMSGKKLTVKEIIKALEYWKKFDNEIDQMLSGRFKDNKMLIEQKEIVKITLNLFDLINRLQEENERLKNAYKQVAWERDCFEADNKRLYEIIENKNIKTEEK